MNLRKLIREEISKLFEIDYFMAPDGREYDMTSSGAIPFLYYEDKLHLRDNEGYLYKEESHWDIINDIIDKEVTEKNLENFEDGDWSAYEQELMEDTKYNGRLWVDDKIISFWKMPEDRFTLKDIVDELNEESRGEFHIDGSWVIRVGKDNKLISLKDFSGGEISDEEKSDLADKWKAHIMSPLLKKSMGLSHVPAGVGSKHSDYSGHRVIDRAVGRAQ